MTATPTPPPQAESGGPTSQSPTPAVPYGPPVTAPGSASADGFTLDVSKRSVVGTAAKWGLRLALPIVLRAIFRAIFR